MKLKSIIIGLILTLSVFIFTSNGFSDWTVSTPDSPIIASMNFGEVPLGASRTLPLIITNTNAPGGANITFALYPSIRVIGGPSTEGLDVSLKDFTLSPGESIVVAVTFQPPYKGNFQGEINIITNDLNQPSRTVSVYGTCSYTSVLSLSTSNIDFGDVPIGSTKILYFTITNTGSSVAENIRVYSSIPEITVDNVPRTLNPGEYKTIIVSFKPTARGTYTGEILIVYDAPANQALYILVKGKSSYGTGIDVSPTSIDFGTVPVGSSLQKVLIVKNNGDRNLTVTVNVPYSPILVDVFDIIDSATGLTYDTTFNFTLIPQEQRILIIRFAPTEPGIYGGALTVVSDDINTPLVTVALSGNTGKELSMSFSPTILNFGNVKKNTSYDKAISIFNTGTETITINSITVQNINGSAFSLASSVSFPIQIVPGEVRKFYVRFTPTENFQYSGILRIIADAGNANISLIGTGSETGTAGLEPQNPPPSSGGGGGGGGCSIGGKREASAFGNAILMFLPVIAIALRKLYRKIR